VYNFQLKVSHLGFQYQEADSDKPRMLIIVSRGQTTFIPFVFSPTQHKEKSGLAMRDYGDHSMNDLIII